MFFGLAKSPDYEAIVPRAIGVSWQPTPHSLWSMRAAFVSHLCILVEAAHCDSLADVALLGGVTTDSDEAHLSLSAGPALVRGDEVEFEREPGASWSAETIVHRDAIVTPGLAVEAQVCFTPTPSFSLGVAAPFNINLEQPFAAVMVSMRLGKLG